MGRFYNAYILNKYINKTNNYIYKLMNQIKKRTKKNI